MRTTQSIPATRSNNHCLTPNRCIAVLIIALAVPAFAKMYEPPRSFADPSLAQTQIDVRALPAINAETLAAAHVSTKNPQHPVPLQFAQAATVAYNMTNSGTFQNVSDGRLWRLQIQSPGARNLNLGFTRYEMPQGAKLWIYDPGHAHVEGPYTSSHRSQRGSLWTPVIEGPDIIIEVFIPTGVAQPDIEITRVNQGFLALKSGLFGGSEGTCENDVVCPVGDPYRDQIRAVAVYTISNTAGGAGCTGTLMNDTAHDGRAFFLSANHCLENSGDPSSVVVYWNFQSPTCGTHGPGSTADNQTGSTLRANYANSDFALFELSTIPDASFNVFYAGWDATGAAPASTVGIHQPSVDVKAISFSNTSPRPADWTGTGDGGTLDASGNHWRVDWDSGVTEPGSSGSCIFDQATKRCIGQLHGGPSACGSAIPGPTEHDYYGMLSVSWNGGGTSATRLKDWLDNAGTGALTNDGDPHITTANGVHYNFQGAGEYVSLRNSSGLEIQTRESPVSTSFFPGADSYDGLATCVSLNTAVAARVGAHRVTYEPNLSGVPDPSGLQLRIDGVLTALPAAGQDLGGGGRIARTSAPGGLEIDFPGDPDALLVTPGWWSLASTWYLNVDVVRKPVLDGTGSEPPPIKASVAPPGGLMAAVPSGTWLPLLPDGSSVGSMPATLPDRYKVLYKQFGDAWRVTDAITLFDYAPGASTSTFTNAAWPPSSGSCVLPGATPAQPVSLAVAEQACRRVSGANAHADCVFDVQNTGHLGFAGTYVSSQQAENGEEGGVNPPPPPPFRLPTLAAFLDLGVGIPNGPSANVLKTGLSLNAGLELMATSHISMEGIFGYHRFPGIYGGDLNIYQFSGNAKFYINGPEHSIRPFANIGAGGYKFGGDSTHVGGNAGAGILFHIAPRLGLEGSYNFHLIDTPGATTRFSAVQGGIRVAF